MQGKEKPITLISLDEAAQILDKACHSVRQLIQRKKLTRYKDERRIAVSLDEVLKYESKKKGLPSWEDNVGKFNGKAFIDIKQAAAQLVVQESYLRRLIKSKQIEGYVMADGQVMVARDSINDYLRTLDKDVTKSL